MKRRRLNAVVLSVTGTILAAVTTVAITGGSGDDSHSSVSTASQAPTHAAVKTSDKRCDEAISKAALVINNVDVGRFDDPYRVCRGTHAEILSQISSEAKQFSKLPH